MGEQFDLKGKTDDEGYPNYLRGKSDEELVDNYQNADNEAKAAEYANRLIIRNMPFIESFISYRLRGRSTDEKKDAACKVLMAIAEELPTLKIDKTFKGWLWGVIKHVCYSYYSQTRRRQGKNIEIEPDSRGSIKATVSIDDLDKSHSKSSIGINPELIIIQKEKEEFIKDIIKMLLWNLKKKSVYLHKVFVSRVIFKKPYQVIALELEREVGAVRTATSRALEYLRHLIEDLNLQDDILGYLSDD